MADPTTFVPGYSYTGWQAANPEEPLPAQRVDNDMANIQTSIDGLVAAVQDVRRSDGALKNGIVTTESLASDITTTIIAAVTTLAETYRDEAGASAATASADAQAAGASAAAALLSQQAAAAAQAYVVGVEGTLPEWKGAWVTATAYGIGDLVREAGTAYICTLAHTSGTFATDLTANRWAVFAEKGAAGVGTGDMLAANNLSDVGNVATARSNLGLGTAATTAATAYATAAQGALANAAAPLASPTFTGRATIPLTTITGAGSDLMALASTAPALMIGASGGANMIFDTDEIQVRNNGAAATLKLNSLGGVVDIGSVDAAMVLRGTVNSTSGALASQAEAEAAAVNTKILTPLRGVQLVNAKTVGTGTQVWTDASGSRVGSSVAYQNTTGRPIQVNVRWLSSGSFDVSANGSSWLTLSIGSSGSSGSTGTPGYAAPIIPHGHYYRLTAPSFTHWQELR